MECTVINHACDEAVINHACDEAVINHACDETVINHACDEPVRHRPFARMLIHKSIQICAPRVCEAFVCDMTDISPCVACKLVYARHVKCMLAFMHNLCVLCSYCVYLCIYA